jgi:hypothetical protein
MTSRVLVCLVFVSLRCALPAADDPEPKSHMKDVLKARAAEDAKKKPASPAAAPITPTAQAAKAEEANPVTIAPTAPPPVSDASAPKTGAAPAPATPEQPPTVLPKVEVKKDRITVLDHNLAVQEKEIAREKKNTTPTELDKALNDSKVSKALSIFGGQSGDYRANISKERVKMMEEEKEMIEAIAHAKTKADKDALQKELDEMRGLRRELEKTLR